MASSSSSAVRQWLQDQHSFTAPGYHYDMLRDEERNAAYRRALELAVNGDDETLVLDIGTGSGLLALLAARHTPAQHVFTCEADRALASAAASVIEANGLASRVTVRNAMSTDLAVGWSADMPARADVIVMEIFDSVLLGEGVLPTMADAAARLLADGGRVVPAGATITGMLVEAPSLRDMVADGAQPDAYIPFQTGEIRPLSEATALLQFDFARPVLQHRRLMSLPVTADGTAHGILFWWTLHMDAVNQCTLSTDPWAAGSVPARDHWRQAACIFGAPLQVRAGTEVPLTVGHDAEVPWMAPTASEDEIRPLSIAQPRLHAAAAMHFASGSTGAMQEIAARLGIEGARTVVVGDGPVLSRLLPGARQVAYSQSYAAATCQQHQQHQQHPPSLLVIEPADVSASEFPEFPVLPVAAAAAACDAQWLVAEPFFYDMRASGAKSWLLDEVIRFWRIAGEVKRARTDLRVVPDACRVWVQPVSSPRLFHTRQPISVVEGVDLSPFNTLAARPNPLIITDTSAWADDINPLGPATCLAALDLNSTDLQTACFSATLALPAANTAPCHAIMMYCEAAQGSTVVQSCAPSTTLGRARQALLVVPSALTAARALRVSLTFSAATQSVWDALRGGIAVTLAIQEDDKEEREQGNDEKVEK